MAESWGQLSRAPDFMPNVAVGLYDFREHLHSNNPRFGDNAVCYYRVERIRQPISKPLSP